MNLSQPIVIISACIGGVHDESRHGQLLYKLGAEGYACKVVRGSYKGETEPSILVATDDVARLVDLAADFDQESVLVVDTARQGRLVYTDTRHDDELGEFRVISPAHAKQCDAWTFDPDTGNYWVCGGEWVFK